MSKREPFVFEETCVPRRVLELFSVKWTSMVLYALQCGTTRTGELQRRLPGISKKMLTQTLRELERDGLIHREVYAVVPPKVEYSLTPLGELFIEPIEMLYRWGNQHADVLAQLSLRRGKPSRDGLPGGDTATDDDTDHDTDRNTNGDAAANVKHAA
ncbi:HxlR family transcriptional regulator [Pandoraea captiosa]|uniref:HxlR family transcriptional regulator n=1 Tax=Pandoraea captiosa TaxID=2508302 RepID=A0A5E4ZV55_9BURK|nr:helix-turn-helix domain-containing protein [Pandoraea captiosa]VVE65204.1 HxlR family transcriptional regulator [Pandoraea captiosa]